KVKFEKATEWHDADIAISFITPEDNGWEISEFTAPIQLKYLEKYDLDIVVLPLEVVDGNVVKGVQKTP
ncbi:hypothetical protein GWO43_19450, partial [candidate division KSB1 bacterium]|nr:hypothetical protein [candidate division KSB1 bacterium]NIR71370.1 hypothetical protein [candidate division KSB1 bacterium]NIT73011.1 hypothetical protein [candidate division KSB1 bacterium]NIU26908.1 hypothetical protein [candidate division KSB1 bacterium]NIU92492.1 hypothetical protein [candidate division KSB1 bacterium]